MMSLAAPWALALLPMPLLVWALVPPHREQVPALRLPFFRRIVAATGAEAKTGAQVRRRRALQVTIAVLCWCLVVLALARPERLGPPLEITKSARDIVLSIDISGSMDARDFNAPDGSRLQRLEGVRQVVQDFIAGREGDRIALIVFGSAAYLQTPLTEDLETVSALLDRTTVGMAGPQTALGDSIGLAIRTFESSDIDQRLLILLSDGSDTSSRMSPINAAEIAASKSVEIHTIGVGDPNAQGEDRVDLAALQQIASRTGGEFFFAEDAAALDAVYARIDELTPREVETLSYRPRTAMAWIPLALAALIGTFGTVWLHLSTRTHRREGLA